MTEKRRYTVQLFPSWDTGKGLAETWKARGKIIETANVELWDLLPEDVKRTSKPDYYVIINDGKRHIKSLKPEMDSRTIIFYMEPRRSHQVGNWGRKAWGDWATPSPARYLQVRDFHYYHNNSEWHVDHPLLPTNEISEKIVSVENSRVVTAVLSANNWDPGHQMRLSFMHYAEEHVNSSSSSLVKFKIWGRCQSEKFQSYQGEILAGGKDEALLPYRYHFNAENNSEKNYFTEKIIDPIMAECLCFYWGCPNLADWIDPDSFVYIDITRPALALAKIQECVEQDIWKSRLPAIRRSKEKIYQHLTMVPTLDRVLMAANRNFMNDYFDQIIVINLDASTDRWQNMERQFKEVGVTNYVRLSATDREIAERLVTDGSWKLPNAHVGRPGIDRKAQLGQLGCKISHWRAVCLAKKKKWKRVIIMEDDAILTPAGVSRFNLGMQETLDRQLSWDLLWIFGLYYETADGITFPLSTESRASWIKDGIGRIGKENDYDMIHRLKRSMVTVCYAIQETCYDQVISEISAVHNGSLPVDDLYGHRLHSKLNSYIMIPCPIGQSNEFTSTISPDNISKILDAKSDYDRAVQKPKSDYDRAVQSAKSELANFSNSSSEETTSETWQSVVLKKLLEILSSQLESMVLAYDILQFWNTQVRPHLSSHVIRDLQKNMPEVKDNISTVVTTRMVPYFEKHLDQSDVHQFLWNAHDIDGLDYIEKVCDILHVTSYYQDYDALSIRTAASLHKKLVARGASKSHIDDLAFNAKFARDRFHNRLTAANTEADLAEKMKICGFQSWVINLDRRWDRYQRFQEQAWEEGPDVEDTGGAVEHLIHRFSAVDGQSLQRTKKLEHLFRNNDFGSNRGALGAALSHFTLWKHLMDGDAPRVKKKQLPPEGKGKAKVADAFLIFEDDVQFLAPFSDGRWITAYERLNIEHPEWDTCFLAFIPAPPRKIDDFLDTNSVNRRDAEIRLMPLTPEMTWGGFSAYLINRKGACKMVRFIEKHGIQHGIDYILMRMQHEDLKMENYLMVPNPCFAQWVTGANDGVDTDIQKKQDPW